MQPPADKLCCLWCRRKRSYSAACRCFISTALGTCRHATCSFAQDTDINLCERHGRRKTTRVQEQNCMLATPYLRDLCTQLHMPAVACHCRHDCEAPTPTKPWQRQAKPKQSDILLQILHRFISQASTFARGPTIKIGVSTSGDMMSCAGCFATPWISSSAFTWSTFNTSTQRVVCVSPRTRPNLPTACCAASVRSALSVADAPVASIDVEFAHFLGSGRITTAAAEVCLLKDTGAVLLHSYICPGAP